MHEWQERKILGGLLGRGGPVEIPNSFVTNHVPKRPIGVMTLNVTALANPT